MGDRGSYLDELRRRVLVFDGAMGTSLQALELSAADFGGPALEGCNDYLVVSRPDVVAEVHRNSSALAPTSSRPTPSAEAG